MKHRSKRVPSRCKQGGVTVLDQVAEKLLNPPLKARPIQEDKIKKNETNDKIIHLNEMGC